MKNNRTIKLFAFAFILMCSGHIAAQENTLFNNAKHRFGLNIGFSGQSLLHVNYDYEVAIFQTQYFYAFHRRKIWGLDLIVQAQYNQTKCECIEEVTEHLYGDEFGLNAGILFRVNAHHDLFSFYVFVTSGPHHISGAPDRQCNGFVFSDNFFAGINIKLFKNVYLDFKTGFRHMSSAGITEPNGGVNNFVISGGLIRNIESHRR